PTAPAELNGTLVDQLSASGAPRSPAVVAAFRAVQRHHFLPGVPFAEVYRDEAIATKRRDGISISSSSQPTIMAAMLEQLTPRPGQRILEIGAGTGYNAALLAHLVGPSGAVVTVDIDIDVVEAAREHLLSAGFPAVQVVCSDGGLGYPGGAPYDAIILSVGTWDIAPAWWEQLRPGGRLVVPLALRGPETQHAIAFERGADRLTSLSVRSCAFMLLRGPFAGPIQQVALGRTPGLWLVHDQAGPVESDVVLGWAAQPGPRVRSGVRANSYAIASGLNRWLALHDDRFVAVKAEGAGTASPLAAVAVYGYGAHGQTCVGLLDHSGISLVGRVADLPESAVLDDWAPDAPQSELEVRSFGQADYCSARLLELLRTWQAAGRPDAERLRVVAYPRDADVAPNTGESLVSKRWSQLILRWD
ncbi:MAG: methyltransferase domain-containing protein, partial [Chloroflexi bacterium]|nr:methyltransferase domain-containing protein [Chloroflexota bacterium]